MFGYVLVALGAVQVVSGRSLDGLWLVLIGLLVVNAAAAEEQQSRLGETPHGVRVSDAMTPYPVAAAPGQALERFIADTVLTHRFSSYPLIDSHRRFIGLCTLNRIRAVPPEQRRGTRLAEIACPADQVPTAIPDEPLMDLLPRVAQAPDGRAVVVDEANRVVGIVAPSGISRAILLRDLTASTHTRARAGGHGAAQR